MAHVDGSAPDKPDWSSPDSATSPAAEAAPAADVGQSTQWDGDDGMWHGNDGAWDNGKWTG